VAPPLIFLFFPDDEVNSKIPDAIAMTQTCRSLKLKSNERRRFSAFRNRGFGAVVATITVTTGNAARYLNFSALARL
jgi:hypothetical protein